MWSLLVSNHLSLFKRWSALYERDLPCLSFLMVTDSQEKYKDEVYCRTPIVKSHWNRWTKSNIINSDVNQDVFVQSPMRVRKNGRFRYFNVFSQNIVFLEINGTVGLVGHCKTLWMSLLIYSDFIRQVGEIIEPTSQPWSLGLQITYLAIKKKLFLISKSLRGKREPLIFR